MAGESTSALWATNNALTVIVKRRIIEFQSRRAVAAQLVTVDDTGGLEGKTLGYPRWPTLSAGAVTEGTDMSDTAVTPTTVQLTAAAVGISFEIMDLLSESTIGLFDAMGKQGVGVVMQKLEDDIVALLAALNGGTAIGTSGSDLTLTNFLDALATLESNQADGDAVFLGHPIQITDLARSLGGNGAFSQTESAAIIDKIGTKNGLVGSVGAIPCFKSSRCPTANAGADRVGAVFTPDAIGVNRKWNVKPEMDRNVRGPSTVLAVTAAYGLGETADQFGVPVITDA